MVVKNRNTKEAKAASVWQMMAVKWNTETFRPAAAAQPDWHPHYTTSETIMFQMVSDYLPPHAEKAEFCWCVYFAGANFTSNLHQQNLVNVKVVLITYF